MEEKLSIKCKYQMHGNLQVNRALSIEAQWLGRFLGITGWDPSVCKSNRLHVHILQVSFTKLGIFYKFLENDREISCNLEFEPVISSVDRCSTICLVQNIGMSMVLNTILPAICGWGDTCSVLVLHDIGSQYPPLIPEAGGGGQYSPPPSLMSRSPKPKYPTPLECSSDRRRCNLLFKISVQQTLYSWLQL